MNRRDFMKGAPVATVGLAVPSLIKANTTADYNPLRLIPKTADGLYRSINTLFKNQGHYRKAFILVGDAQVIRFKTYFPNGNKLEGFRVEIDEYFPTPEQAIASLWETMLNIKADVRHDWTEEMIVDHGDDVIPKAAQVWWRMKPEIRETQNKLYTVRMRAAFT